MKLKYGYRITGVTPLQISEFMGSETGEPNTPWEEYFGCEIGTGFGYLFVEHGWLKDGFGPADHSFPKEEDNLDLTHFRVFFSRNFPEAKFTFGLLLKESGF